MRGVPDGLVFTATVALSARYFGLGPSLFAIVLSMVAIDYTMLPPLGRLEFTHPEELAYFVVFVVFALLISGMTHSLRIARADAESHVVELEHLNRQLVQQMEETRVVSDHLAHANEDLTTARDSAERLAARANRLLDVTTALSEAQLPQDVARVVVGQGFDVLEAVVGMIAVLDGNVLRVLDRRWSGDAVEDPATEISLDDDTPLTAALRKRETVWLDSPERYRELFPRAAQRFRPEETASAFLALPLLHGDELVGGLVVGFKESSAVGAVDQAFAGLLAQAVGSALARAKTFEREREDRRYAEMLLQAREEVLGVVAHDLRNPLGVAGAVMEVLGEEGLHKSERDKLLLSGARAVRQMNRLISDLLDVMRMEAGRLSLELEELPVGGVLAHAEESARHLAREARTEFVVEPADPTLRVRGDRGRLAQVFDNLVGNAIKFTPEGGRVSLRAWPEGADVVFEVADTGSGIPPENLAHLFDRFWQANRADRRGVGLGLPIAKGIVDAHNGRIWVVSSVDKGSEFYVAIPRLH